MMCHVCSGELRVFLEEVADAFTGDLFSIDRCTRCGLGHTLPQPEEMERYYGVHYYGNRHGVTARHCVKRRLRFVRRAGAATPGRLLDVGCGDGSFLLAAREHGWQVTGTEIQPEAARQRGLEVADSLNALAGCEPFDCVTLWHSLEHLRDPRAAFSWIADRLRPGGRVIVAVPDNGGLQAKIFGRHWLHLDVPRHLYHFDRRSLGVLLDTVGLRTHRVWHQEFEYDLLGWSQSALNAVLPVPNVFFHSLIGKPTHAGRGLRALSFCLGVMVTAAAIGAVAGGAVLGRGGTLIVAAQKP